MEISKNIFKFNTIVKKVLHSYMPLKCLTIGIGVMFIFNIYTMQVIGYHDKINNLNAQVTSLNKEMDKKQNNIGINVNLIKNAVILRGDTFDGKRALVYYVGDTNNSHYLYIKSDKEYEAIKQMFHDVKNRYKDKNAENIKVNIMWNDDNYIVGISYAE